MTRAVVAAASINRIPLYSIVLPALGLLTWLLVGKTQSALLEAMAAGAPVITSAA